VHEVDSIMHREPPRMTHNQLSPACILGNANQGRHQVGGSDQWGRVKGGGTSRGSTQPSTASNTMVQEILNDMG